MTDFNTQCSPHAFLENRKRYSIILNLLGIDQKNIYVDVNASKHEVAVRQRRGRFWIFAVPNLGQLQLVSVRYKSGVLEISIPKMGRKIPQTAKLPPKTIDSIV